MAGTYSKIEEEDGEWIRFLGGNSSLGIKKYRGLNSNDGGNTGNGVKIADGVIGSSDEIELLPPKKQIYSSSSSSTALSNSSRNQTCDLVSPSSSVYTPTPPQIFEVGKCPIKMYLKHHEEQIEDILNYLDELSFHCIEKMEEGRIDRMIIRRNSDKLKTELKKIRTQIVKL
ncbi:hypothetical protein Tco_0303184 [Tanacetum coccineum]